MTSPRKRPGKRSHIYENVTDSPIRFVANVLIDTFGGPGVETFFMIMPGDKIDLSMLGLEPAKESPSDRTKV